MSFISYAQNFEDVMLWRALKHIDSGFYIDVGANDPVVDSVTKAFYDHGWKGINIEPLSSHFADLQSTRPRDINLACAAGPEEGEIEIWECDVRGWASADTTSISMLKSSGEKGNYLRVPMKTLANICENYAQAEIHFLKIDVEGFEKSVLAGADFRRFRPWIVVIEANRPNSKEEVHQQWEELLLVANYSFAYADGLNRFYVANEHAQLAESFKYPPNTFDNFVTATVSSLATRVEQAEIKAQQFEGQARQVEARALQVEAQAQQAEVRALQTEARAQQVESRAQQVESRALQAEAQTQACLNSMSWRITAPLRMFKRLLRL